MIVKTDILPKLKNITEIGVGQWKASCPCPHNHKNGDVNPSFVISVTPPPENKVLMHCFAGCKQEEVIAALGLTGKPLVTNHKVCEYKYTDLDGKVVHSTIRWEPKTFTQHRIDPTDKRVILYNLKAVTSASIVFLCEGEKDADSLISVGTCATTAPMGASNLGKCDLTPLHGKTVVLCPDTDEAGSVWKKTAIEKLLTVTEKLLVVDFSPSKDVTEWMIKHPNAINEKLGTAKEVTMYTGTILEKMQSLQYMLDTYTKLDDPVFDGIMRVNEVSLLAASPKTGKTLFQLNKALACACGQPFIGHQCITPLDTLYIDNELSLPLITMHVRRILEETGWKLVRKFDVLSLRDEPSDYLRICKDIRLLNNRFVVLDALYKTLAHGMDENSNTDLTQVCMAFMEVASKSNLTFDGVHHAAKGNVGERAITDRASGAGALTRSVDQLFTLVPHDGPKSKETEFLYDFEGVSRSFKSIEPTVLQFRFPLWRVTDYASKPLKISDVDLAKRLIDWKDVKEIATILNIDRTNTTKRLNTMVLDGLIECRKIEVSVGSKVTKNVYKGGV